MSSSYAATSIRYGVQALTGRRAQSAERVLRLLFGRSSELNGYVIDVGSGEVVVL